MATRYWKTIAGFSDGKDTLEVVDACKELDIDEEVLAVMSDEAIEPQIIEVIKQRAISRLLISAIPIDDSPL